MSRKIVIPKPISQYIGRLGLSRQILLKLLNHIHVDMPEHYNRFRQNRVLNNEDSQCTWRFVIKDGTIAHLFSFAIDDTTSPDHLIIVFLRHDQS